MDGAPLRTDSQLVPQLIEHYRNLFIDGDASAQDLAKVRAEITGKGHGTAVVDAVLRGCEQIRLEAQQDFASIAAKGVAGAFTEPTPANIRAVVSDPSFKARAIVKGAGDADIAKALAAELRADPSRGGAVVRAALDTPSSRGGPMGDQALSEKRQRDIAYAVLAELDGGGQLARLIHNEAVRSLLRKVGAGDSLDPASFAALQRSRAVVGETPAKLDAATLADKLSQHLLENPAGAGLMLDQIRTAVADGAKWRDACWQTLEKLDAKGALAKPELAGAAAALLSGTGVASSDLDPAAGFRTTQSVRRAIAEHTTAGLLSEGDVGTWLAASMVQDPRQARTLMQATRAALSPANVVQVFDAAARNLTDSHLASLGPEARQELYTTLIGRHLTGNESPWDRSQARARNPLASALFGAAYPLSDKVTDYMSGLSDARAQASRVWWLLEGPDSPRAVARATVGDGDDAQVAARLAKLVRADGADAQRITRTVLGAPDRRADRVDAADELLSKERRPAVAKAVLQELERTNDLQGSARNPFILDLAAAAGIVLEAPGGKPSDSLPPSDNVSGVRAGLRAHQILAANVTSAMVHEGKAGRELAAAIKADPANGGVMLRTLLQEGIDGRGPHGVVTAMVSAWSDADLLALDARLVREIRAQFPSVITARHVEAKYVARLDQALAGR